jgi:hypothetical protein
MPEEAEFAAALGDLARARLGRSLAIRRGGAVMWSIRASVGVASFGANALAARLAVLYACKQGRG